MNIIMHTRSRRGRGAHVFKDWPPKRRLPDEDTREMLCGPLTFDVSFARAHGYSEVQIQRIAATMSGLVKKESVISIRRYPDRNHRASDGTVFFMGPCCVCDAKDPECIACNGKLRRIKP